MADRVHLQRTVSCAGPAGADDPVTIQLQVPVLELTWDTRTKSVNRVTTSETASPQFVQAADETAYHIAIDDAFLTGSGRRLATQFLRDDLDTFNPLIGARDSVEMSGRLLALGRAQTRWDAADGPKDLLTNTIFKLSPNVTPADTTVIPDDPPV